jgi:AraC-like DNA-binding protein
VTIVRDGCRPFVANANVIALWNAGEHGRRAPIGGEGDRSEWFECAPEAASRIGVDADRPFALGRVPADPDLYLTQRRLFNAAMSGRGSPRALEAGVLGLFARVVTGARTAAAICPRVPWTATVRQRDAVHAAEIFVSRYFDHHLTLPDVAAHVGLSVFHLCRSFRRLTGYTVHGYRQNLRVRAGLELVVDTRCTLTEVAMDLGFGSHSHFTETFRLKYGYAPSAIRRGTRS